MPYKDWFYKTLTTLSIILLLVIAVNYLNDPLWVSDRVNFLNKEQQGFNERQQKTNKLFFTEKKYDSVMLGNSKVTYINQNHFKNAKLFNYALSDMRVFEFDDYINFFKEKMGQAKYIILGIDFSSCLEREVKIQKPEFYIQNSKSNFYQYKQLLSYDTLLYSFRNFLKIFSSKKTIYDRNNVKIKQNYKMIDDFEIDLKEWEEDAKKDYQLAKYNKNFEKNFSKIRLNNPKSKIITIFLPDFMPKFLFYDKSKAIYNSCVKDAEKYSDLVFNFMKFNKITIDPNNYYYGSHFKPEIGKWIMDSVIPYIIKKPL